MIGKMIRTFLLSMFICLMMPAIPIIASETEDELNIPIITGVEMIQTENLTAPGEIKAKVTMKDPTGYGVTGLYLGFQGPGDSRVDEIVSKQYDPGKDGATYEVTVSLGEYKPAGEYRINFLGINSVNSDVQYTPSDDGEAMIGRNSVNGKEINRIAYTDKMKFIVSYSEKGDSEAPVITKITPLKDKWDVPGEIQFDLEVVEEGVGIDRINFTYKEEKTGYQLNIEAIEGEENLKPLGNGKYRVTASVGNRAPTGRYNLYFASAMDKATYDRQYGGISLDGKYLEENAGDKKIERCSFDIENTTGETSDYDAPVLKSVVSEKKTVQAPSVMKFYVELEDESDITSLYLAYESDKETRLDIYSNEILSGKETNVVYLPANQYILDGNYKLSFVGIVDSYGNDAQYPYSEYGDGNGNSGFVKNGGTEEDFVPYNGEADFTVTNPTKISVRSRLGNPDLKEILEKMENEGTAVVAAETDDVSGETIVRRELFEAIQGTDKTIIFENGGVQWVFSGQDIDSEKIKDIDISVDITPIKGNDSVEGEVEEKEDDPVNMPEDGYQIIFADNGDLPGIVKMRINLGYEFYMRGLKGNTNLFWLNEENNTVEKVENDVNYADDSYAEFDLTHNSTYFLSNNTDVPDEPDTPDKPNEDPKPGHKEHTYVTVINKATLSKNGSIEEKCSVCGNVKSTVSVYYPSDISLSRTDFTYNGKVQKPTVNVKGSDGKVISASDYILSYDAGCKKIGHYAVTVTFKGNYEGTVTKTFNINPKGTKISRTKVSKKKAVVRWKKQKKEIKGYQIQYSTNKGFVNGAKIKTVKGNKKTSVTIKGLKSKRTYYVRIRTYQNASGGKCYSEWSGAKKVKVK